MLKTYLKVAFRNLWKNRLYTSINIAGLSIGLAASVLIVLFVRDELSYDQHFEGSERIYRLTGAYNQGGDSKTLSAITSYPLMPVLAANFPEMESASRFTFWDLLVSRGDQHLQQENIVLADSSFFDLFSFEVVAGDPAAAIREPNSIVLTESTVKKHFGDENGLGEVLSINDVDFKVAAIVKDVPANTHFEAELFLPLATAMDWYGDWVHRIFNGTSHYLYFKLASGVQAQDLQARINTFLNDKYASEIEEHNYSLQPMADIHLKSELTAEIQPNGSQSAVTIFSATALVILLLACINYINLSVAGSFQRSREVGLKKVFGAGRSSQVLQFQAESLLVSLVSCVLAVILIEMAMPSFNRLTDKAYDFQLFDDLVLGAALFGVGVLIGLISGSFPALFLLKMQTSEALRGSTLSKGKGDFNLRNGLVVFQFFIVAILIASTMIILNQVNFLRNMDLGIDQEQVILMPMQTGEMAEQYDIFRDELLRNPGVVNVTATSSHPANRIGGWRGYTPQGSDERINTPTIVVSYDFFETMGTTMVAGRSFDREHPTDIREAYILNEAAVKFFQMENPVGTSLVGYAYDLSTWTRKDAKVIGVVKDFHFASLHNEIRPVVFSLSSEITTGLNWIEVRITPENTKQTLAFLEDTWSTFSPDRPFEYDFLDENIAEHYAAEDRFLKLFTSFSLLSIIIGSLGLFGLTAFMMKRRTKEIGIRKVLGAEVAGLVAVLSRDFLKLVLIANILGWPLAYYMMDRWLQNFAYNDGIPAWVFVFTGVGALAIAFASVAYHSIKTAGANPVNSIRYE
ncbi:MAG: ABC transporter permease [Roseivirga sp.]